MLQNEIEEIYEEQNIEDEFLIDDEEYNDLMRRFLHCLLDEDV